MKCYPGYLESFPRRFASLLVVPLSCMPGMFGQDGVTDETAQLREELRALKSEYEQRIQQLEERLRMIEESAQPEVEPVVEPVAVDEVREIESPAEALDTRRLVSKEFRGDTESREQALLTQDHPFAGRVEQVLEDFVEVHGYVRAGYGRNSQGGPQVGFKAPGAGAKYRLGNEAENYAEITFAKQWYDEGAFSLDPDGRPSTPPGPIAHFQATLAVFNPFEDQLSADGSSFSLPETWASISNVIDSQPTMKFWAGSRFYRRHDIHISDFFFYNMSGGGGGVEDIQLPWGKFNLAWIGWGSKSGISSVPEPDPENEAGFSKQSWDLRLHDVPVPFGRGEFGLAYARSGSGLDSDGNVAPAASGVAFNFIHTRNNVFSSDGVNKFSLQYGTGPALTFSSGFETFTFDGASYIRPDDTDAWRFRITENFTANLSDSFSIGPAFVYEVTDFGESQSKRYWASAGVRPILHFNEYLSFAFEGGVDWVKDDEAGTDGHLAKVTFAPQVSLGDRFMSRPVLRTFVTYSWWSTDFIGQVGGIDYADEDDGLTAGVQMEVWW